MVLVVFIPIESNVVGKGKDDAVCVEDRPAEVEEEAEEKFRTELAEELKIMIRCGWGNCEWHRCLSLFPDCI